MCFRVWGVCLQLFEVCSESVNDYINADAIRFFHISFYTVSSSSLSLGRDLGGFLKEEILSSWCRFPYGVPENSRTIFFNADDIVFYTFVLKHIVKLLFPSITSKLN